ncbi:N-acetylneuraminate synthase family protein [Jutongia hominis]|jgi:sialic acid synthase SpsE/quercetin dioxygenase-like cupin family protein|uniref:N-acetylneuraminate synthase family protein n=1 Tax=Jutongia hominis TaxID=2763664 RepID=A0ABR7MVE8_9FIRM|nr:N-acetylneuraminate synthase family protein [Jutongia hominis]MBC8557774.1 N-acetylneuraminate synthase family protein [Jutongia hominis]
MSKIFDDLFIFEMANSHQGSVEHGKDIIHEMGKIARKYNIKAAVKLQYRNLDTFIHPDYKGRKDVNHIPRFESTRLTYDQFTELVEAIRSEGMIAMSTPFDEDGVDWCMDQGLDIIKVASCSSLDWPLLEKIAATHKPVIISVGGKTISDIDKLYNYFTHKRCDFAFMHCIAEYPAPIERLQLDFIDKLRRRYPDNVIGYSGHEDPDDNVIPMMAIAKGAKILERHVGLPTETISLNAYSMNPDQADKWVKSALEAKEICKMKKETERYISQAEIDSLNSLMRGVYLKHDVKKGTELKREDVFFAMPNHDKQMTSGEFFEGVVASKDYKANEELHETKPVTDTNLARSVIHDVKGMLYEANIYLGDTFEAELSHHYGMKHFRQFGAVIISIVNREYCKKLIAVLPGQQHPDHMHKVKEETFQLLYGDLEVVVDGEEREMKPGDIQTVLRGQMHSFSSRTGAVFEEISTTHVKNDSYYEDPVIAKKDLMERKTKVYKW